VAKQRRQQLVGEFRWPPRPTFFFYSTRGTELFSTSDTHLDLADSLMLDWSRKSRKLILGINAAGSSWPTWTEARLKHVEKHIKYDLNFDGYSVSIQRLTLRRWQPCTKEFQWKLAIRTRW
jgi:hypothetical protein